MDLSAPAPTSITINPAPAATEPADWRDTPLTRRHMADRYSGKDIAGTDAEKQFFGEDGLQVADVLDVINPLQHIPFVSTLYREMTGDTISAAAKIAGGTLLGGPIGLVAAVFDTIFEAETGHGVVGSVVASLTGESKAATTQLASAQPQSQPQHISEAELLEVSGPIEVQNRSHYTTSEDLSALQGEVLPPAAKEISAATINPANAATQVLELYGASASPQQKAYRDANMLGYLQNTGSTNLVM